MVQAWMKASYILTRDGFQIIDCDYTINDNWVIVKTLVGTFKIPINAIDRIKVIE